ncbi:hypothetical protein [Natronosalvus halobius]|uniref:hypothetical protein n=1 Tax=Natronosalvus halobius TaxID=2953746 RepID=UPI0020A01147|nr:hypothetical protein [Natronosalvus halobius]USZ71310.1 hypothetical protein NGM15_14690 [Natronosalvus halobius]
MYPTSTAWTRRYHLDSTDDTGTARVTESPVPESIGLDGITLVSSGRRLLERPPFTGGGFGNRTPETTLADPYPRIGSYDTTTIRRRDLEHYVRYLYRQPPVPWLVAVTQTVQDDHALCLDHSFGHRREKLSIDSSIRPLEGIHDVDDHRRPLR